MPPSLPRWKDPPSAVRPMLATVAEPPLKGKSLIFEPKYDGIRALVDVTPRAGGVAVRIWSRLGNDKTAQFPSLVNALREAAADLRDPLLLDGEIVALDQKGQPAGFQRLQGRIHLTGAGDVARIESEQPVALILFDLLRDGDTDIRGLPLTDRRARLDEHLRDRTSSTIRLSEQVLGDGTALDARAAREGWEGLIVKEAASPYQSGRRSPAWRKRKRVRQQEFVIGGWTEPRQTRSHFGALLLGVYVPEASDDDGRSTSDQRLPTADDDRPSTSDHRLSTAADHRPPTTDHRLEYVGHTGTGFDQAELTRVWKLLKPRETPASPFAGPVPSNERPHWVRPELVAQVRFTEWTDDRKLRHPVYLGLRDDKAPESVVDDDGIFANNHMPKKPTGTGSEARAAGRKRYGKAAPSPGRAAQSQMAALAPVIEQLRTLEHNRKDGTVTLPDGSQLGVTNLWKVFWPQAKLTKGDLLRYYATVSPFILPAVADRPLVMKRFPNGVDAPAFYQQRSRLEKPPGGVRILQLPPEHEPASEPDFRRFIGGSLITLLYTTQIAAISQDPWFSRVQHPLDADYVALDLDPDDDAPFERVLEVARYLRDELESLKVPAVPKTSGSSGLHIYIPLPPGTSYESGMLFCQIVATIVAARHPRIATVERKVKARARGTVYVDYLQNILGKTLATAYSARASAFAGVSTPLEWKELDEKIDPRDFTITTAPARFAEVGDLWARLRTSKPANLEAVFRKYAQ